MFCTGINLDDIMHIAYLAYKYLVFFHFSLVGYNIWYCVPCEYGGTPSRSPILYLSEISVCKIDLLDLSGSSRCVRYIHY